MNVKLSRKQKTQLVIEKRLLSYLIDIIFINKSMKYA